MKIIIAIFILLSLLLQSFAHYSVIALFQLRRDYIAKNLCENRNKPELKCCGKCILNKQLNRVGDSNDASNTTNVKVEKWEVFVYILPQTHSPLPGLMALVDKPFNPARQHMLGHLPLHSVFRPPAVS